MWAPAVPNVGAHTYLYYLEGVSGYQERIKNLWPLRAGNLDSGASPGTVPVMRQRSLHPNLARLRHNWQEIYDSHRRGEISAQEATRRMHSLRAPDDQGVMWLFGVDRKWYFIDSTGQPRPGEPPAYGIPGPAPEDLSSPINTAPHSPLPYGFPYGAPLPGASFDTPPSPDTQPVHSSVWLAVAGAALLLFLVIQILT